jgi:hypothetical protein
MGLLGAMAQGMAKPMNDMTLQMMQDKSRDDLMQKELSMREEISNRAAEAAARLEGQQHTRNRGEKVSDDKLEADRKAAADKAAHGYRMEEIGAQNKYEGAKADALTKDTKNKEEINKLLGQRAGVEKRFTGQGKIDTLAEIDSKLAALGYQPTKSEGVQVEEVSVDPENPENKTTKKYTQPKASGIMSSLPDGLPAGSYQIGTSNGKPVYQTPDGKRLIGE